MSYYCSGRNSFVIYLGLCLTIIFGLSPAQAGGDCPNVPGDYKILNNQTYALCAGAQSVNFGQITYAKCKIMPNGTSVSKLEAYPYPPTGTFPNQTIMGGTPVGNIVAVNQLGANQSYMVSTYSAPANGATKLYTCQGGSYAQCDGGLCFKNTSGKKKNPLWGDVASDQIICSCPVTTAKFPYQVFGPASCPTTAAAYDAVCGASVSNANNGAVIYIGSVVNGPDLLAQCLATKTGTTYTPIQTCTRPTN